MHTKPFGQLSRRDTAIAGGKGASLGDMAQAGLPVPEGFVVLVSAFEQFLKESHLEAELAGIIKHLDLAEINAAEAASAKAKSLIMKSTIPASIAHEILASFKALHAPLVAVRSSATAEDSESAAWAGQLESYLNVSEAHLLELVKQCWASLFTPRAITYRFAKQQHQHISVAVVVQKMVASEAAGVAFSVHPVTQDSNHVVIEAGLGFGEAVVGGQIIPDNYVVAKKDHKVIEKHVAKEQILSDPQMQELAALVAKIERHYSFPVDVEWACEKGTFYIVQSRPITTLR